MTRISVEIQGSSPLLMNRFTEAAAAKISAGSSSAITISAKGTPRDQAEPKLYTSADSRPMIPGPNIFRGLIDAGAFHKAGRKQITTQKSSLVPAGIQLEELECAVIDPFNPKEYPKWEVDSRSVVNPATGGRMMCHRPRFDAWKVAFTLIVDDKMFDESIVRLAWRRDARHCVAARCTAMRCNPRRCSFTICFPALPGRVTVHGGARRGVD